MPDARRAFGVTCALALVAGSCGDGSSRHHRGAGDGGADAASASDGAPADAGVDAPDAGIDAMPPDAGIDAMPPDAGIDAMPPDAGIDAPPDAPPPPPPPGAVIVYPEGPRHSPIDSAIVARLQSIVGSSTQANVFAKVGDSITASPSFLTCFDGGDVDLGTHAELADTLGFFVASDAGGQSPFARTSQAAIGGATTSDLLAGDPSPLARELAAIDPRYAVIMLGTNDVRYGRALDDFASDLWTIVDRTIAAGVIPILSTIPPSNGDPSADARVPTANRLIRAIAQGRRLPLVDYHRDLLALPSRGISSDGIHPTVADAGACQLTVDGLRYGYNVRNLITVEALARTRAAVSGTAADVSAPTRSGTGRAADPYVAELPLVDLGDTRGGDDQIDSDPCSTAAHDGPEVVYRVELSTAATITARVVDRGGVDVDVQILQGALSAAACVATGDHQATATVAAGPVYIVVDTRSGADPGEYLLVVEPG